MSETTFSPYHQELGAFRLAYSKGGAIVSVLLVLIGVGLDYSLYRSQLPMLIGARALTMVLTLIIIWVMYSSYGLRWARPLTLLWLALPQVMIAWMIWATDGTGSIYFVGLHLALYATGIILPIEFLENLVFGLFSYMLYFLACYFHPSGLQDFNTFAGTSLFILFSVTISSFCTYFNERGRLKLFSLQRQVAEKNAALQSTNDALAQVKGQLLQREKMAALGTLSAGLLHEVNNPVNYSLMALNMALQEPETAQNPALKESLTDAKEGMQRVQSIVTDLKTFAYQKPGDDHSNRIFLLEKVVQSALRLTGYELKGIEVILGLPQDTHVLGDEPAIIGVLINLFSNAGLATRASRPQRPRIDVTAHCGNGRLSVHVRDNGAGIKPENLNRVFEPFFTTRDVGQGLGLGLSMSYSIIQRHGGVLTVASEEGLWTEFSFDLALAHQLA
ncbi:sensor histidine kinase [Polaromonas sp. LjRoot131]|uniref:sensor histidine kinase n=1 Tax=Polaromonas sp. LjRoot131 TaxID=3342262 RepID=UPI003ECEF5F5